MRLTSQKATDTKNRFQFPWGNAWTLIFYRKLENDKSVALNRSKGDFDAHMYLTPEGKSELNWWILNIETSYHTLHQQEPQQT